MTDRHSKAAVRELITDPVERAKREALNGLRQIDFVNETIDIAIKSKENFRIRPSLIAAVQSKALDGITTGAGQFRNVSMTIEGSRHQPPPAGQVLTLVEDMCDYINSIWMVTAVELAAYVMWRINWIHPFEDGNGRTSRAIAYMILCIKLGYKLPGQNTIPEQISKSKNSYYKALESADKKCKKGTVDVSILAKLISDLLAKQLTDIHADATRLR